MHSSSRFVANFLVFIIICVLISLISIIWYMKEMNTGNAVVQLQADSDTWKHVGTIGEYRTLGTLLSRDARYVAVGFRNSTIKVYDTETLEVVNELNHSEAELQGISWDDNSPYTIKTLGGDINVRFWNIISNELKTVPANQIEHPKCGSRTEYQGECIDGVLSPDKALIYRDHVIRDLDGNLIVSFEFPEDNLVMNTYWSQDSRQIAFIVDDRREPIKSHERKYHIEIWELDQDEGQHYNNQITRWDAQVNEGFTSVAWRSDGLLFATMGSKLLNVKMNTSQLLKGDSILSGIGVRSPDSKLLVTSDRNDLTIWRISTQEPIYKKYIDTFYVKLKSEIS